MSEEPRKAKSCPFGGIHTSAPAFNATAIDSRVTCSEDGCRLWGKSERDCRFGTIAEALMAISSRME